MYYLLCNNHTITITEQYFELFDCQERKINGEFIS